MCDTGGLLTDPTVWISKALEESEGSGAATRGPTRPDPARRVLSPWGGGTRRGPGATVDVLTPDRRLGSVPTHL